ncbi:MAG: ATP-binding protein [Saprospiraceae bacterium]|nr:ATP-binding protein [Saprospiraceae bacterium]
MNRVDRNFNLQSDEIYLKIILRNIISNAIKFTKENGYILVDSKVENEIVQIIIRDTGIGISSEKINKIFKLFESSTGTKKEKGSGLGLSLSLDIAKS